MTTGNFVRPVALPTLPDIKGVSKVKFNGVKFKPLTESLCNLCCLMKKNLLKVIWLSCQIRNRAGRLFQSLALKTRLIIMRLQISEASLPKIIHQPTFREEFNFFQVWKYKVLCHIWLQYAFKSCYKYKLICLCAYSSQIARTNLLL